jgi:hypothetical protein
MAYTASSFVAPLLAVFRSVAGVLSNRTRETFSTHPIDPVLERVVLPAWHGLRSAASGLRPMQRGGLQIYLLYVVATVVMLLLYLLASGTRL